MKIEITINDPKNVKLKIEGEPFCNTSELDACVALWGAALSLYHGLDSDTEKGVARIMALKAIKDMLRADI
ncbi:hypothetical protein [uncultured Veillonella sp.]|uniref:hypothetical protein n=1 Tax=uncultured Veillonella sp. TaxID=159268 RepID=UPI0025DA8DB5|nr:hypothetical protein [uncultured Veillonella sp.]